MPKQFTLRFPVFVWTPTQDVVLQTWEALSHECEARDLRACVYKIVHPQGPEFDRITVFTLRDIRNGVAEYWPKSTSPLFPLLDNMKAWNFKLISTTPIYGNVPPGESYCGACGEGCETVRGAKDIVGAEFVSKCCWGSLWADPSLTVEWREDPAKRWPHKCPLSETPQIEETTEPRGSIREKGETAEEWNQRTDLIEPCYWHCHTCGVKGGRFRK